MGITSFLSFPKTKSYQTIPTQWSNHVEYDDGSRIDHGQYLCLDAKGPREVLALRLLKSLGREGNIYVYSDYELSVIGRPAEALQRCLGNRCKPLGCWD